MNNLDATMFMVSQSRKKNGKSLILEKDENEVPFYFVSNRER